MTYIRYGNQWKKEVMKNEKSVIVDMLRTVAMERDELYAAQQSVHWTLRLQAFFKSLVSRASRQ